MPDREQFSGPDNAWRRMGETENLMTITGILMFDEKITYEELCDRLEERLLRFERFRQKVSGRKRSVRRPSWETVEDFDIEDHVYELTLPEPKDQETFERFIGTLMSRPVDERRPLWEVYLLQDAGPDEGNAMAIRLNHSIGDGFALMYVLLGLVDDPQDIEFPIDGITTPPRPDLEDEEAAANGGTAVESGGTAVDETDDDDDKSDPREKAQSSGKLGALGTAAKGIKTGYDLLTMDKEPDTSLVGELGPTKRAGWTQNIDLDRVKRIGKDRDATVNDVLLAATAGALRRVLEGRGEDVDDLEINTTIPVNLKPMEDRDESLGNYFGLVFVPLPVGVEDLDERIELIHDRMDARKAGIEAFLMYQLLNIGGKVPEPVQEFVMKLFQNKATGIVTNVPGPLDAVEFSGKKITDIIFWVPQANGQGIGISIISYNGGVRIGVTGDANLLPDAHELTEAFETEIDILIDEIEA